ncbi:C-C motif chemokine 19-like [Podarcis raffonei]|uniref:C-C motif chemokine 19-like n=1 Tax=Podarcis raffonei TaxID=65483 RepID=UPI0023292361|nr:C-C motif chemokine 19-like [Podarcis raffonei]
MAAGMAAHGGWILGLVALCVWSTQQVSGDYQVMDCCVRTSSMPIPAKVVRDYRDQYVQDGCPVRAVIFITIRGRNLCAPPHTPWVKHLKETLNRRNHNRRAQFQVASPLPHPFPRENVLFGAKSE